MKPDRHEPALDTLQTPVRGASSAVAPEQRTWPSGVIPTAFLFQGRPEILISHKGEQYRLRITRNDKLILTK